MLSCLGFSASYDEVNRYKQCVVQCDTEDLRVSYPSHFTQWSGDNMDHNLCTLDGQNTVHGMDIVSMSTPYSPDVTGSYTHTHTHHTHNRFTVLWILSRTARVSRYQKKHSPTHTHSGHQSSLSAFSIYYEP